MEISKNDLTYGDSVKYFETKNFYVEIYDTGNGFAFVVFNENGEEVDPLNNEVELYDTLDDAEYAAKIDLNYAQGEYDEACELEGCKDRDLQPNRFYNAKEEWKYGTRRIKESCSQTSFLSTELEKEK